MLKVQTAGSLVKSASGHMVHAAAIYPGFCSIDGMLFHRRVTASIKFSGRYTRVERGIVRVTFLAGEHNVMIAAKDGSIQATMASLITAFLKPSDRQMT